MIDPKYIENAKKQLDQIMFSDPCPEDWSRQSLSIRDAVLAAATIFQRTTDKEIDMLNRFVKELVVNYYLPNLSKS